MYAPHLPLSAADSFLEVKEGVDEMIKYLANEPSVGLYFVQKHAHANMPGLLTIKESVAEKIHEVTLHTEDMEDSILAVKSMAEDGLPIADEMIKDINKSLLLMSTSKPKRGLIQNPSWGFPIGNSSSGAWDFSDPNTGRSRSRSRSNYLSVMFNTAKQKAAEGLLWSLTEKPSNGDDENQTLVLSIPERSLESETSTPADAEGEELPVSTHLSEDSAALIEILSGPDISSMLESYSKFKVEQELKLQQWLGGPIENKQ